MAFGHVMKVAAILGFARALQEAIPEPQPQPSSSKSLAKEHSKDDAIKPDRLEIRWFDGRLVGHLVALGQIFFQYAPSWIETGHNLSPITIPFQTQPVSFPIPEFKDLPGMVWDSLPDAWDEKAIQRAFDKRGLGTVTPLKMPGWLGVRTMGALTYHPAYPAGELSASWDRITTALLEHEAKTIVLESVEEVLERVQHSFGSAGGAHPKATVSRTPDGRFIHGGLPQERPECRHYLLKFDFSPTGTSATVEHAYALMAKAAGIDMPATELVLANDPMLPHKRHLLIERFDVRGGERLHFQSLAGILQQRERSLDYADLIRVRIHLDQGDGSSLADIREIIRRMLFNALAVNRDDHSKNHAFRYDASTKIWALSPAFDLTHTPTTSEHALSFAGKKLPTLGRMGSLALDAGLSKEEFNNLLDQVSSAINRWEKSADQAGASGATDQRVLLRLREVAHQHNGHHVASQTNNPKKRPGI